MEDDDGNNNKKPVLAAAATPRLRLMDIGSWADAMSNDRDVPQLQQGQDSKEGHFAPQMTSFDADADGWVSLLALLQKGSSFLWTAAEVGSHLLAAALSIMGLRRTAMLPLPTFSPVVGPV